MQPKVISYSVFASQLSTNPHRIIKFKLTHNKKKNQRLARHLASQFMLVGHGGRPTWMTARCTGFSKFGKVIIAVAGELLCNSLPGQDTLRGATRMLARKNSCNGCAGLRFILKKYFYWAIASLPPPLGRGFLICLQS